MKTIINYTENEFNEFVEIYGWKPTADDIIRLKADFETCISKLKSVEEYNQWVNNGMNFYRNDNNNIKLFFHVLDTETDRITDIDVINYRRIKNKDRYMFYMYFQGVSKLTIAKIEKEIETISKKLANAFIEDLSAEDYGKLLDRKIKLTHKLIEKKFKEQNHGNH